MHSPSVNADEIYFNDEWTNYVIASADSNDQVVLHVYDKDPDAPEYILTLYSRDGYYVMDATETATNTTCLYYNSYVSGYSRDWAEYILPKAVDGLNSVKNGYSVFHEELEKYVSGNDARAYVYSLFVRCGSYKDSAEHVNNFTILKDMLLDVNMKWVDNLGNTGTNDREEYAYDSLGRYTYTSSYAITRLLFGTIGRSGLNYIYDKSGSLVEIYKGYSNSKSEIYTPTFDANGNLVSLECRNNSGSWTNTYTYDANGNILSAVYDDSNHYLHTSTFTYDEAGRLIREVITYDEISYSSSDYIYTIDYTYDVNGHIATEVHTRDYITDFYNDSTVSYTYTCDAEGDPISAVIEDSTQTAYESQILEYIYADLYYYAFEN